MTARPLKTTPPSTRFSSSKPWPGWFASREWAKPKTMRHAQPASTAAQAVIRDAGITAEDLNKARQETAAEWEVGMIFALLPGDEVLRFFADLLRTARRFGPRIFTAEPPETAR